MIKKSPQHTREIGQATEDIAYHYLIENGLDPVTKNFSFRAGEIDLIMQHDNYIVFIEVRYRKNTNFGYPEETVSLKKQHRIKTTASLFIAQNSEYKNIQPRFDVIAMLPNNNSLSINWIKNAF